MGWLFFEKPRNVVEYFRQQIDHDNDVTKQTMLDMAIVGMTTGYCAVEQIQKATGERKVFALILLMQYVPKARDGYTFGYKDMDEFSGPTRASCPARILDLLTPLTPDGTKSTEWAIQWRARCRAAIAARRQIVNGAVLYHRQGISYQGEARHWFHVLKRERKTEFYCLDGGFPVKFPRWARSEVEVREVPVWTEALQQDLARRWNPETMKLRHAGNYQKLFVVDQTDSEGFQLVAQGPYETLTNWYNERVRAKSAQT